MGGEPDYLHNKEAVTVSPLHVASLTTASPLPYHRHRITARLLASVPPTANDTGYGGRSKTRCWKWQFNARTWSGRFLHSKAAVVCACIGEVTRKLWLASLPGAMRVFNTDRSQVHEALLKLKFIREHITGSEHPRDLKASESFGTSHGWPTSGNDQL